MTIECKDLEWEVRNGANFSDGITTHYVIHGTKIGWELNTNFFNPTYHDSLESAQAAANDHNKQQFQQIIEEWRKG